MGNIDFREPNVQIVKVNLICLKHQVMEESLDGRTEGLIGWEGRVRHETAR